MNIDDDNHLYQMLFDNTCMLSIRGKPMILITLNMAKTWTKEIPASCFSLMSRYHLKPCMSRSQTAWSRQASLAERSRSSFAL
jgi:hypothetical protein